MSSNQTLCRFLEALSGARCYTDASTTSDMLNRNSRRVGLGIFILNPRNNSHYYIKLQFGKITFVVMAEAVALAFAAAISSALQIDEIPFLTDCQLLVNFFNGADLKSPPYWEAKPFTQSFLNSVASRRA